MKLTERDMEALGELRFGTDQSLRCRDNGGYCQPIDCGGSNGSDHSYRFAKLVRAGLAERKRRGGYSRGSWKYRITDAGRRVLEGGDG